MRWAIAASAVVMALPSAALAECPTRADLANGITLTRFEQFFQSRFVEKDGRLIEGRIVGTGENARTVSASYMHGLLSVEQEDARGHFQMVVFEDPAALDRLPEITRWVSLVQTTWNGEFDGEGVLTLIYIEPATLEFGPCSYETWLVQSTLDVDGREPIYHDYYYAPDIGVVVLSVTVTAEGDAISNVFYDAIIAR